MVTASKKHIAYYRVSTKRQGESGLGLDAQRTAVSPYAPIEAYTEVETGKKSDRPELQKALAHAKATGATLVVAKLDRLARNVHFISSLMESGVDFVCVDQPNVTPFVLHVLAAVAEYEASLISERTKAGLAEAKKRGKLLGARNPVIAAALKRSSNPERASQAAHSRRKVLQKEHYAAIVPAIIALRDNGFTFKAIARHLNEKGYVNSRGNKFSASQVYRVLQREEALCAN